MRGKRLFESYARNPISVCWSVHWLVDPSISQLVYLLVGWSNCWSVCLLVHCLHQFFHSYILLFQGKQRCITAPVQLPMTDTAVYAVFFHLQKNLVIGTLWAVETDLLLNRIHIFRVLYWQWHFYKSRWFCFFSAGPLMRSFTETINLKLLHL